MLKTPLSDLQMIEERRDSIAFFQRSDLYFAINREDIDFVEYYLEQTGEPRKFSRYNAVIKFIDNKIKPNSAYYVVERGVEYLIYLLNAFHDFVLELQALECPVYVRKQNQQLLALFDRDEYKSLKNLDALEKLTPILVEKYDFLFRNKDRSEMKIILQIIYEYDVFQSVAGVAKDNNLTYPDISPSDRQIMDIEGLFHPFVKEPVLNDIFMDSTSNMCFITGPNMAGKSTFLRSVGLAYYLAHTGFPVAAQKMHVSLLNGISTSINIVDNLNLGYSHFYTEVLRVRDVAQLMKTSKRMLVIFDELFRGTNVKDALDASVEVVKALSGNRNCFYFISSHLIEIADEVKGKDNIIFASFDVETSEDKIPTYTYKLKEGVSANRVGMHILRREKVIETIMDSYS